jgi:hypothetical protein
LSAIRLFNPYALPWYYRPLQNLWFLGNRLLFGLNPAPFYWQMALLHALAVALVYRVLRQFGIRPLAALLATALFAVHGHYVDVVGWNSSVAIVLAAVFSLLSLSFYLDYLRGQIGPISKIGPISRRNGCLALSFLFFLLALLTHEEAILLPLFLLALTAVKGRREKGEGRRRLHANGFTRPQVVVLGAMMGVTAVSIIIQFTRPNLTIDISETGAARWLGLAAPAQIGQFIKDIFLRYTLTLNWEPLQNAQPLFLGAALLILLLVWFILGNWTVRLGLLWLLLHLGLIYATLWQSKPNLLAGRHFYQASIGLALAFGGSFDQLMARFGRRAALGRWRFSLAAALLAGVVTAVLLGHVYDTRSAQQEWLARAEIDRSAREQLQALLPTIGPETRLFANRFPITPGFFRSVTAVWYDLPAPVARPSGSFTQLQQYGRATRDYYVFDYEAGKVYNLMPELQLADETIFLWSHTPRLDVVGESGETLEVATEKGEHGFAITGGGAEPRFAVKLAPTEEIDGWLSLAYVVTAVPENSSLQLGVRTDVEGGGPVRVRLETAVGETITLFEGEATGEWLDLAEPMGEYAGQSVVIRLDTAVAPGGAVYWGNPRFAVEILN